MRIQEICIQDTLSLRTALGLPAVQPLDRVRRASKGILHTNKKFSLLFLNTRFRSVKYIDIRSFPAAKFSDWWFPKLYHCTILYARYGFCSSAHSAVMQSVRDNRIFHLYKVKSKIKIVEFALFLGTK